MPAENGPSGQAIAIVGMAGRYPDARTLAEFWRNLANGVESLRPLSPTQLLASGVSVDEFSAPGYVRSAAVLDDMEYWDAGAWGFTPLDASIMDPQHRLFLECAWEALEDAGHTPSVFTGPIGVFAGCGAQSYLHLNLLRNRALMANRGFFLVRHTGNDKDFLATRVSYELDLHGPSISVQTACSTSLVAVHLAAQSLLAGECDLALAGGVTIEIPHRTGYQYREQEILSPDGHCRSFDSAAAGTVFGSGAGIVALRRLEDAERDGDRIHAIIRGSAVNNDGANKVGYLAPSVDGQAAAIVEALAIAEVSAESVTYIEAHGTGTAIGDPIEVAALTQAFRASTDRVGFCALGSVKPNIGHLDTAAGIASLTKTVLAMQHRKLPPSLHCPSPHRDLRLATSPFVVNTTLSEWQSAGPRRAGVSSLGVGGTNAHIVLEEAPPRTPSGASRDHHLITMSAHTESALDAVSANLADRLEAQRDLPIADVAFTLAVGRKPLAHRRVIVARSIEDARRQLDLGDAARVWTDTATDRAQPVFLFAGGGAQFVGMGAALFESEPVYRAAVEACLAHLIAPAANAVRALLRASHGASAEADIARPSLALPALFATQYAMAKLLQSWGVTPTAMLGHSMGEYTAAHMAGVITLRDAMRLVTERGRLFEKLPAGAMLSVSLCAKEVQSLLSSELSIAAINAPSLCVVSGPVAAVNTLAARLTARGIESQRLHIDVAAHSSMLTPILGEFEAFVRKISFSAPTLPYISNESGTWITAAQATDPAYWVRHLRHTVHFADGVTEALRDSSRVLIEVGPGRVLTSLARLHPSWSATHLAVTTMRAASDESDDLHSALLALGRLWARGVHVNWTSYWADEIRQRVALPTYPWERQRHWIDAPTIADAPVPAATSEDRHERVESWFTQPLWRQTAPPAPLKESTEHVLVFTDTRGLCETVTARLVESARRVTTVTPGDAYARDGAHFTLRPTNAADHQTMLEALIAEGATPQRALFAWGVPKDVDGATSDHTTEHLHALLAFARALSVVDLTTELTMSIVTASLQRIGGEARISPWQALLTGAAQVLPRELPHVRTRTIDVVLADLLARDHALAARIAEEVASESQDEYVAFRGPMRYVQELQPLAMPAASNRLRDGGVYLITGGLSGVGYAVAEFLASTRQAHLVLLARTTPAELVAERTRALEALGAQVLVVAADVTDVAAVRTALGRAEARFGSLHGVFHAAGVLRDSLIARKTESDVERVLAPKVAGTLALDAALGDRPLDLFVLFSSISARAGLPGQSDYAAANAFLDAFALERTGRLGQFAIAVAWSAWKDTGMSARVYDVPPSHPLLGARLAPRDGSTKFAATLSAASHWVLGEHRLRGGRALLPGTAYLELARAAAASGDTTTVELRDVSFRSPFIVPDGSTRELRVHLSRPDERGRRLTIAGRVEQSDGTAQWQEHVTATVKSAESSAPRPLDIAAIEKRCDVCEVDSATADQHAFVDFGPRWQNVRRVRLGTNEALAELTLSDAFASDLATYALHPALMDMATAFGLALVPGIDTVRDFYVPLSFGRVATFAPLAPHILSYARYAPTASPSLDTILLDITITDPSGHVLVEIEEFLMTRVASAQTLEDAGARPAFTLATADVPSQAVERPAAVAALDEAIRTDEGLRALELILAGPAVPQVVVAPFDATVLIQRLRRQSVAPTYVAPPAVVAVPALPLSEIEAVLATHESLRQGVVLQRPNRPGELKLVAYIVLASGESVTVSDLRRFLRSRLPNHLVPSTFVELDALPTHADGSIDRASLPDPFGATDDFASPQSSTEIAVAEIWQEVLGVARIGRHDNFFDAGGHSLLSVRALTRINKRLGVLLEQSVMVLQTLGQVAAEIDRRAATQPGLLGAATDAAAPARTLGQRVAHAWRTP